VSFEAVTLSRAGGREVNEDYVDVLHTAEASCWVVADGLGGHRGGAIASKLVVETALRSFQEQPEVSAAQVERHVEQAQEALLAAQRSDASLAQMRSTIVVLVANDREAVWGHVGDSRLYHLQGGRIAARTRDHSVSQALVDSGQIDQRQQGLHEDRSRLLRSLGKEGEPGRATIGGPQPLCREDAFLLCTDGFWEALDDTAVEIDYAAAEDAAAWLDRLDARLRAQDIPLKDNYTAAAIRVTRADAPVPPPHDPRRGPPPAAAGRSPQSAGSMAAAAAGAAAAVGVAAGAGAVAASPPAAAAAVPVPGVTPAAIGARAPYGSAAADLPASRAKAGAPSARHALAMRVLYALMAIALIALLYTAFVAYTDYAAARRGHTGDVESEKLRKDVESSLGKSGKKPAPSNAVGSPPPATDGVTKSPAFGKQGATGPDGAAGAGGASADGASAGGAAGEPATPMKVHYASAAEVPAGKVFRPAKKLEYASLREAIEQAAASETIWIGPGDLAEEIPPIAKAITLKGAGRDQSTLALTGGAGLVLTGDTGGVEDLALTAADGPAVLEIGGAFRGTIARVRVHDGKAVGILVRDTATPTIIDTAIENNRGGPMMVTDRAKPKMP
jgi:serine/threonine protein phosphatase PrpC